MHELVQSLFDDILGRIRRDKAVVYFLPQPCRIGQLVMEMFWLASVYPPEDQQLIVVVPDTPDTDAAINPAAFRAAMRHVDVLMPDSLDKRRLAVTLAWSGIDGRFIEDFSLSGATVKVIFGLGALVIRQQFLHWYVDTRQCRFFTLDGEEEAEGRRLMQALRIDPDAEIVALHARDSGYINAQHLDFRNAAIGNYVPAVEFLLREGYTVVRMGDPSMRPLPLSHPRLIDAPFNTAYERHGDVYFTARSAFMVHTLSGPTSLAFAYGRPGLASNATPYYCGLSVDDLLLPKRVRRLDDHRPLSLQELAQTGLIKSGQAKVFENAGVYLEECSPDALLAGVEEMHRRHRGAFAPSLACALANARFRTAATLIDTEFRRNAHLERNWENFYGAAAGIDLAEAFLQQQPDFI
ncbi:TIGR04372 family glycosyltransferase [Azospirillum sp. TSO22-1]|uniref:TIGR04372 family glycosyltransferase n=1 Tax=Azospirillum sp. TSO22-1 TaxID=716789 RepID=UPI000D60A0EC|nr:TIGR04372 family glycosyltransferase [Azospirillum sp. TSO22-1]PWC44820.1 hypothetical protein TSO221_16845 [Azospirillum sp. TSO22-1]